MDQIVGFPILTPILKTRFAANCRRRDCSLDAATHSKAGAPRLESARQALARALGDVQFLGVGQLTALGGVDELADGIRDPAPDGHAVVIAGRMRARRRARRFPRAPFRRSACMREPAPAACGPPPHGSDKRRAKVPSSDLVELSCSLRSARGNSCDVIPEVDIWRAATLMLKASCPPHGAFFRTMRIGTIARPVAPQACYFFAAAPALACGRSRRTSAAGLSSRSPS
jgi:hypothetical protein